MTIEIGPPAVLDDLVEIRGDRCDELVRRIARRRVEGRLRQDLLQLVQNLDREAGEIVNEIEGVLDFVGDAGGELPERGELLGLNKALLRVA